MARDLGWDQELGILDSPVCLGVPVSGAPGCSACAPACALEHSKRSWSCTATAQVTSASAPGRIRKWILYCTWPEIEQPFTEMGQPLRLGESERSHTKSDAH